VVLSQLHSERERWLGDECGRRRGVDSPLGQQAITTFAFGVGTSSKIPAVQ